MVRRILPRMVVAALGMAATIVTMTPARGQAQPAPAQRLDDSCIVSILNRNIRVKPNGTWVLPNVPATFGQVRARVTCVRDGQTLVGESAPFTLTSDGSVDVPPITLGVTTPIPSAIAITAPVEPLRQVGASAQLAVLARYDDGSSRDITTASTGTRYAVSNAAIASVTLDGRVIALASGSVIVQASHEGASGFATVQVALSADTDGDGIADDLELTLGLNPNDVADGYEDLDLDGVSNRDEAAAGSDLRDSDSDDDTLLDGEELRPGADGYITNPRAADTDSDGVRDALEISTGSDPTDASSVNLSQALTAIAVSPSRFTIYVTTVSANVSQQLSVVGQLRDGTTIDLTSTQRGTQYASSDIGVCNFAGTPGRVFGSNDGTCTVTITNATFSVTAEGVVSSFQPTRLSSIAIPGYANNVDANGAFAYVAAGGAGLVVVDVSRPQAPQIIATLDTPGNANDVRVVGTRAFVADGLSGLRIIDVTNPGVPADLGSLDTPGEANDVIVSGNWAYVADGAAGVQIIDVTNPSLPVLRKTIDTPGVARGVDVEGTTLVAVDEMIDGSLHVIDVADPANALLLGSVEVGHSLIDVDLTGTTAVVAAYEGGAAFVDVTTRTSPTVVANIIGGFGGFVPRDVQVAGTLAIFAEQLLADAAAPIVDVATAASPQQLGFLDFGEDYAGTGIAVSGPFIYLTGERFFVGNENGTSADTKLFIGAFLPPTDDGGIAPTVALTAPTAPATATETTTLSVQATASDDLAVRSVTFTVDGVAVFTDTSEPYATDVVMPAAPASVVIGAFATDYGGNVGSATNVSVSVIADPMTTATGRVIDGAGAPVAGATVSALGRIAQTQPNGTFSLVLPTLQGDFIVVASAVIGGETVTGRSARFSPLSGATVAVGDISLGGVRVGYFDIGEDQGSATQEPAILAAGGTPVPLGRIVEADLATIDILVVQNGSQFTGEWVEISDRYDEFVQNGGVMIVHDRRLMTFPVPGLSNTTMVEAPLGLFDVAVTNAAHPVNDGPHGQLTDTSLDDATAPMYGYADATTVPQGTQAILHHEAKNEDPGTHLVTFAYPYGQGWVIYSTVPITYFYGAGAPTARTASNEIYLPNLMAWAMELARGAQP